MKIAIFTDTFLPDVNGVVTSIDLERRILEKRGHEVYIICSYPGSLKIKYEGHIVRLPGLEIKKLYGYALAQPIHLLLIEELRALKFDVIHANTEFGVGIFANICANRLDVPLVRTYHTTYEDYTHYLNFLNSKLLDTGLKKAVALLSKTYGQNCLRMIAPSNKTKEMLRGYGVTNTIDVIPTGIELGMFKNDGSDKQQCQQIRDLCGVNADERLLVYIGRIAEEKAIDLIITAMKKVKECSLKLKLAIVGDGPQLNSLKALASELGVDDVISFLGKKPFSEIPLYYHAADAFISASTSETQGMTYVEALSSGLPIFARYDEVLKDIVYPGKNGYFFKDEDELVAKLKEFTELDQEQLFAIKNNAVNSVRKYDADNFGAALEKLFAEVVDDYSYSHWICKTVLKDDYVVLTLKNAQDEQEVLNVSLDDYYAKGFRSNSKIINSVYLELKKKEEYLKAYRSCLRKIATCDRTVKQIRDHLFKNFELDADDVEQLIARLKDKHLLDDEVYVCSRLSSLNMATLSRKMMVRKLKNAGIDEALIDKYLHTSADSEAYKALKRAEKIKAGLRGKSINMKKQLITRKLLNEGFSADVVNGAVEQLDFSNEVFAESELLRQEAQKAYNKYAAKYQGTKLRNMVFQALVNHGFNYEDIYAVINGMEW